MMVLQTVPTDWGRVCANCVNSIQHTQPIVEYGCRKFWWIGVKSAEVWATTTCTEWKGAVLSSPKKPDNWMGEIENGTVSSGARDGDHANGGESQSVDNQHE